jgi:hypothetical protein
MTGAAKRKAEEDCSDERSIPANSILKDDKAILRRISPFVWHIAIFGCTAKIGRNRGMPDIAGQLSARSAREWHKATDPGCLLSGRYRGISAGFELRESPIRNPAQILIQCRARNGMASVVVTYLGLFFRQTRSRAATHFYSVAGGSQLRSRICDRTTTIRGRLAHQTFYGHVEFGTHFNLPAAQPAGQHICPEAQSASAIHAPHEDSAAARIELIGDCDFESLPALNARYSLIATCDNVICSLTAWLPANVRIATTTTATARSNLYMTTSLMMPIHHVSQPTSNPRIVDFLPLATDYAHIKLCQLHQIPQICQLPTNSSHNGFQKVLGIAVATMLDVRQAPVPGNNMCNTGTIGRNPPRL